MRSSLTGTNRRRFLRGLGTMMALPTLEAFAGKSAPVHPTRFGFVYTPNGVNVDQWTVKGTGTSFELSPTLSPLEAQKKAIQVISGLSHDKARANGDGGGDHARATTTFLTGAQARKTGGADFHAGVSIDQVFAKHLGGETKLPTLELGCDEVRNNGRCDSGYSCVYQYNMSWKSPTLPMSPETDPRLVFERLFGNNDRKESAESAARRRRRQNSVLDFVMEDAKSISRQVSGADKRKIDEYLDAVRATEQRIERSEAMASELPGMNSPTGIPASYQEHIRLMYDLMAYAFQTDTTRISTFLVAHDGSNRSFPQIGVPDGHHHISHHGRDRKKLEKIAKIDRFYVEQFGYFLEKLASMKEGDGNLLEHSMICFGGGISDADRHDHSRLPVVLAGGGSGTLQPGRHLDLGKDVPMSNFYLGLLEKAGISGETRFGDSTGIERSI